MYFPYFYLFILCFSTLFSVPCFAQPETDSIGLPQIPQDLSEQELYQLEEQPKVKLDYQNSQDEINIFPSETCLLNGADMNENAPLIREINVEGSTVLNEDIVRIISQYQNQRLSQQELFCISDEISNLYQTKGYITSGAFLPKQEIIDKVHIQVVEGKLAEDGIEINNLKHINSHYILSRLEQATERPLNKDKLEEALQLLLLENDFFESVDAELAASIRSGENILKVNIKERSPFATAIAVSNSRPPNLGEWETSFQARYNNFLGLGDRFSANYGLTEGLDTYSFNYEIPFNYRGGIFKLSHSNNDSLIISQNFRELGIRSRSKNFSVGISQPIFKTPNESLELSFDLDVRQSQSFILNDIPFSFSLGPENGESNITAIRASQSWYKRSANDIFAINSQFSFGIDAFNATINNTGIDGDFFKWLGQVQYVRRLSNSGTSFIAQLNTQLTPDSLLSLEKFSAGGLGTVRGYPQNYLVGDNGLNFSLEFRLPIKVVSGLSLRPFLDSAFVWNNEVENSEENSIISTGLGLTWQPIENLIFQVDYAFPLSQTTADSSLQSQGLNLGVTFQPLMF